MKQVLFMAMLAAGLMLAGCGKEDTNDIETKQQQTLTKEQIIGVWRNGDYWVSFSESGYASAFLKLGDLEMIDDGDYRLSGDTIFTMASPWLLFETPYAVNYVTDTEISLTVEHVEVGVSDTRRKDTVILQKSQVVPCERNDGLAGKFFYITVGNFENRRMRFNDNEFKTIDGSCPYVYLAPYLYFLYQTGGRICIGELSNLESDTISYTLIRF